MTIKQKPSLHFRSTGIKVSKIKIEFHLTKEILTFAVHELLCYASLPDGLTDYHSFDYKIHPNKQPVPLTAAIVEKEIRSGLKEQGCDWVDNSIEDIKRDGVKWVESERIAKKLFPYYFININDNSLRFIAED